MRHHLALRTPLLLLSAALAFTAGCLGADPYDDPDDTGEVSAELTTLEGFEIGSKTSYALADVALTSGTWRLDDALIGTSTSDVKTGTKSARARNTGKITMRFDRTAGAGTVTIRHAKYGTDASSTWGLFSSTNQGTSWTQVGSTITTSGTSLATATFTVDLAGTIRFEIRKLSGGASRINFDDISITDSGGGGGGGGGGSGASISKHTTLGLPSPSSTSDSNSYLSVKSGYVLSYNSSRKIPNWVSWELNTSYLGTVPRQDTFRPDDTLPLPQASLADYSGSGYDRGHMCPSADRTKTTTANSQTFYLTNMIPQASNNNQGPWAALENESRTLAQSGKELFIISGGIFSGGTTTIGAGVWVPTSTFKVIVVLPAVGQGASSVTTGTRVIAVVMPNRDSQISVSTPWRNFRVSVDAIEAQTGFDLLSDVAPSIQAVIEASVDNQ